MGTVTLNMQCSTMPIILEHIIIALKCQKKYQHYVGMFGELWGIRLAKGCLSLGSVYLFWIEPSNDHEVSEVPTETYVRRLLVLQCRVLDRRLGYGRIA